MSEIRGQFLTRIASITGCASKSNFLSATAALLLGGAAGVPFQAHAQHGISLWTNSYDGGSDDLVGAIAVDRSGNVFLTGRSWGPGPYGNAYCFATVAYTSDGVAMWTNRYHGPANSWDGANAIATDTNGNVFVTGYSDGVGTGSDFTTIKYSGTGIALWTNRYNGPANGQDYGAAMVMDRLGNVFVTGYSTGIGSDYDYATVAYSNAGLPLWTNRYNGPGNGYDRPRAIALDANGNVFVTGYSTGIGSGFDYATLAYSSTGVPLWTNRYNGPANGEDRATALSLDSAGNVFVTGYSSNYATGYGYLTIAYANSGAPLWTNRYNGPAKSNDYSAAIVADSRGDIFVTGRTLIGPGGIVGTIYYYGTIAYSAGGIPLWTNLYNGGGGYDSAVALAVDSDDNLFVTGSSMVSYPADVMATVAYTRAGAPLWTKRFTKQTEATAITLDTSGNVFVTGYSVGGPTGDDYWLAKYSSSLIPRAWLNFQTINNQLVLTWTNAALTLLQTAPAINAAFTNVPGAASPYTNSFDSPRRFFRLSTP